MTPEERLDQIEIKLAGMQKRMDTLAENIEDVSVQLSIAMRQIEILEERSKLQSKSISLEIFRNRLN